MTPAKRLMDITLGLSLLIVLFPLMIMIGVLIWVLDGRPIMYLSARAKTPHTTFQIIKFRTMRPDPNDFGASGGHKTSRITPIGAILRHFRLDEVPQVWNVIRGDMSLVGPRPPLPLHVKRFPILFNEILKSRPGITGLASIYFHRHEERLLRHCESSQENERIYEETCIPRKARLDLIYARNRTVLFDTKLLFATIFK